MNKEFEKIMRIYVKKDMEFFKEIHAKFIDNCAIFKYICSNVINSPKVFLYDLNKIGQKITILYETELNNIHDIKYDIWKEISINEKISKLVKDNITNGFPLMGPHFLIKTNKVINLFDNPEQYKKIEQSEIATTVKTLLDRAISTLNTDVVKKHKRKNINNIKNINNFINFTKTKDHNYAQDYTQADEFWLLRNNIKHDITHADNFIITNTAINMISEHAGRTFYDICVDNNNKIFADSEFATFNKYMFQICYNLYCLNTKVHCIHRDLHMNNIIISPLFNDAVEIDVVVVISKKKQKQACNSSKAM
jgi:hypothetical protein